MLRSELLAAQTTLFAGYVAPHPLQPHFLLKIQTDGTITPREALEQSAGILIGKLTTLEAKFKREFAYKGADVAAGGAANAGGADPTGGMGMDAYGTTGVGLGGSADAGAWSTNYPDY